MTQNFLEQLEIEFINQVMNQKNRHLSEIMVPMEKGFLLEENQLIDDKIMKEISDKSYSFIPVYRKEQTHIIGYVNSKTIIMNYLVLSKNEALPLKKLVKGRIFSKAIHIYSDAVAIEALGVL